MFVCLCSHFAFSAGGRDPGGVVQFREQDGHGGRHPAQPVPGVRRVPGQLLRHAHRLHPHHHRPGQDVCAGLQSPGTQDPAHQRVHALRRPHRRALLRAAARPQGHGHAAQRQHQHALATLC